MLAAQVRPAGRLDLVLEEGEVRDEVGRREGALDLAADARGDGLDEEGDGRALDVCCFRRG